MKTISLKNIALKALPYVVALAVFYAVSALYFAPQFEGKTLQMTDVQMYQGMRQDILEHRAAFDEDPQWTGGMFGGMPAYLISVEYPAMFLRNAVQWGLNLMGEPVALMFLAMAGFWLMLLMAGVNPWVAIPAALAYGLSTYNILIIEAGHITKMRAMGYAPMLVGAVFWTFRRNVWVGGALTALFGALTIAASHHQITYYFLLVVVAYLINNLIVTARAKSWADIDGKSGWKRFCTATGVLAAAAVFAMGANFTHLWYTFEHSPETIRGGSELVTEAGGANGDAGRGTDAGGDAGRNGDAGASDAGATGQGSEGLDLEYATAWSYGIGESGNMFIPNLRGGGSSGGFEADGEVANVLRRSGIDPSIATQLPGYWGDQPFTGGPTYLGAVMVFLFVLGMFVLPARKKWWVLGVSVLGLLLAWGSNMMWFTELSFAVLPGYNRFRTVSMALAILQWAVPFVAALAMWEIWKARGAESKTTEVAGSKTTGTAGAKTTGTGAKNAGKSGSVAITTGSGAMAVTEKKRLLKGLWWSLSITGGVALLFALFGGMIYDFASAGDAQFDGVPGLVDAMQSERAAMLRADAWRSLMFVVLTAAAVWAVISWRGFRRWIFVAAVAVLATTDLVAVDMRYLSWDDFKPASRVKIAPDEVDRAIMADDELGFRVLNTDNPFNEAFTSYFHRSVGGYHGAKLSRYQDVIDRYLSRMDPGVLNMLDTKYIISTDPETGKREVSVNPDAYGAAWMVDEVFFVRGARAELDALGTIDTRTEAVVNKIDEPLAQVSGDSMAWIMSVVAEGADIEEAARTVRPEGGLDGGESSIKLTEYRPNYLKYETLSESEQVAVFSEIYYDKGWKAYIDGIEMPYFRADYILRAMVVPAGEHTIEWKFRAPRFALVEGITLGASIVILLWLAVAAAWEQTRRRKTGNDNAQEMEISNNF